jgi:signal transduction histidine kinase
MIDLERETKMTEWIKPVFTEDRLKARLNPATNISFLQVLADVIIGYTEMLRMQTERLGWMDVAADLQKIHTASKHLFMLMDDLAPLSMPEYSARLKIDKMELDLKTFRSALRHDLKTPLSQIIGYCELLLEYAEDPNQLLHSALEEGSPHFCFISGLHRIHRVGKYLLSCIDEVADLLQPEPIEKRGLDQRPFDPSIPTSEEKTSSLPIIKDDSQILEQVAQGSLLIVDDNEINRDILSRRLIQHGYTVATAENGYQALETIKTQKFDLILLDLIMPEMNGYQVLKRLKADSTLRSIPVIMISAISDTADKVQGFKMGAVDYVTKPIQPEEVLARVSTHLTLRNLHKNLQEKNVLLEQEIQERERIEQELIRANKELRDTQIQLVQSEKMVSLANLVAGLAHEINTPIGSINSMNDTLGRAVENLKIVLRQLFPQEYEENPRLNGVLKILGDTNKVVTVASERVTHIVRNLRNFARLDEAELKRVDIHESLEATLRLVQHQFKDRIEVVRNFSQIPAIVCYPSRLNHVFLNILVNAGEAIKGNGKIGISTFQKDHKIHVIFKDNGLGIRKEHLSKIFDPGFTTKGVGVGTGLGLSICYQIIKDHKGEIKVESEPGQGSAFTIILPMDLDKLMNTRPVHC